MMTAHSTEISVPARLGELTRLHAELAGMAATLGLPETGLGRLQLIAEELFTNTVQHGFRGDSDSRITLRLRHADNILHLHYSDPAPAFDPTRVATTETPENGGFGIPLVLGLCRRAHYSYQDGRNVLELEL